MKEDGTPRLSPDLNDTRRRGQAHVNAYLADTARKFRTLWNVDSRFVG